jgi:hypothetical protein
VAAWAAERRAASRTATAARWPLAGGSLGPVQLHHLFLLGSQEGSRYGAGPRSEATVSFSRRSRREGGQMDRRYYGPMWAVPAILVATTILVLATKL